MFGPEEDGDQPHPPHEQTQAKGWLQKLPLVGGATKPPGMTKDEIIGFYCHQAGDVQL